MIATIVGGLARMVQALGMAAPTLLTGLLIAAIFRYYLGREGTHRLFGGNSFWSLPQAWLVGMLLPVCSIGVLPILVEMYRQGVRRGALIAFALSAPLFNPLSLLYGLTLSRPVVIIGFALASLVIVTLMGVFWDRLDRGYAQEPEPVPRVKDLRRLWYCLRYCCVEICGTTGALTLIGASGSFFLAMILPMGALQNRAEQMDWTAVPCMTAVAIPVYSTPLLVMSQLGGMFDHGNSPGAGFVLLILGTGLNLATVFWFMRRFGIARVSAWLALLIVVSMAIGWGVDRPLITPGVRPAGHTHAFDIYTNPLVSGDGWSVSVLKHQIEKTVGLAEQIAAVVLAVLFLTGLLIRLRFGTLEEKTNFQTDSGDIVGALHREVSTKLAGVVALSGLIAFSIVGCYAWYPNPKESMEELTMAKTEVLTAALSSDTGHALRWLPIWEDWIRKLEVGYALRNFELRPYQQIQSFIVREKLELLEHELEHLESHGHTGVDIREICMDLEKSSSRLRNAFVKPAKAP